MNSLVSIIIPTYNRANLISETLDSIIIQTYTNWECIIVDDGSTDNSFEIINKYVKKDSRFQLFSRPTNRMKGANACRNFGFEKSKGDYIKWFDSDDIMYTNFIKSQVIILENEKKYDFCICLADSFMDNTSKKITFKANRTPSNDKLTAYLTKNHYFFTASPLWKKSFLNNKTLFDEELSDSQESDFHFNILSKPTNYIYTADVLFSIRRDGNLSITQDYANEKSSNLSRLKFFLKAFQIIKKNEELDDKNLLLNYVLYRQLILINYLCIKNLTLDSFKYSYYCIKNIFYSNYKLIDKLNIIKALMLSLFFKKGFKTFFKYKIYMMETIEN